MAVLVGKTAPNFEVNGVTKGSEVAKYNMSMYKGKYVVLFFYPFDFTFVCPTELHAFQEKLGEFERRGVQVLGCSVDSHHSHIAWLNTPKAKGGIQGITYPLLSDINKDITKAYDVLCEEESASFRGLFLIDRDQIVRHQIVNDLPLGRNVDEALRMVDALQFNEKNGEVCPANWQEGKQAMKPSREGVVDYFEAAKITITQNAVPISQ
ncbi:MAG: peroxiredoxin (alkyl hydroperoxide reductase subunit C) [Candidatus Marinamargulisbacteria bacterium]|jgi:peroxiredoxin (alkyl hydroperoxide reductase subunit C)